MSSTAVYGARGVELGPDDVEAPTLFPYAAYACAKFAAETTVRALARARGVRVTVLRPSMVYGPGIDSALESIRRLATRGVSLRLSPGHYRQHLLHMDLLVEVMRRVCERTPPAEERVFAVADPFVLKNADIAPPRGVPFPIILGAACAVHDVAARLGADAPMAIDALAVLAVDNVFPWRPTFEALELDPASYDRSRTFDPYWEAS